MYTRAQKESSSVSPTSTHKKSNGSDGSRSFSVHRQPEINSSQEKEIPSYSRNAADSLIANVMRSLETQQQEQENTQGVHRQIESAAAPVAEAVMPMPPSPTPKAVTSSVQLKEVSIQRQCSECAEEQQEQSAEDGKDFDEMSLGAGAIQTKLTVGAPGDKYEQEADRVAAQVMSMSVAPDNSPQVQRFGEEANPVQMWSLAQSITPVVQRQVDEQVQMRSLVQRAFQAGGNEASGDLESRLNASKGKGSALSEEVRSFMEPRFGADFSSVRVHTGGEAVQMNRELGAQAFTHGSDVFFGAGKSPGNNELTAHELTHVVQQTSSSPFQQKLSNLPDARGVQRPISKTLPPSDAIVQRQLAPAASTADATQATAQAIALQAQADVPQLQRGKDKSEGSAATPDAARDSTPTGDCATVYIWLPHDNNVGHSSIDMAGTYASFWPNQDTYGVVDTILDALNPFGGTASTQATHAQDVQWEVGDASNTIQLCCLNIPAMHSLWSRIRSEDYEAAGNNCSTVVGRLINAGLQQADCDVTEQPVGECLGAEGEISGIDRPETLLSAVQCLEQRGCDNNWQCEPVPDHSRVPL
ncbi:hypothetical protein AVDCRST_MAG92-4964 [uncultured Coleofasciculus sp.]|uniref:eCIS core domain-containing protein n=1 Tax=uncultured Coleofasciculus sp. TaxID=1267456 RepID=A0A6J4K8M7_9CYAN|nr:hypothetical protein AVDCRST_MAG92-4964 [uncultured Coleofasciculus sp.]